MLFRLKTLLLLLLFCLSCSAEIVDNDNILVLLQDLELKNKKTVFVYATKEKLDPAIHIIGQCKISEMKGTTDKLLTIQWLGLQYQSHQDKIALFSSSIETYTSIYNNKMLKDTEIIVDDIEQEILQATEDLKLARVEAFNVEGKQNKLIRKLKNLVKYFREEPIQAG